METNELNLGFIRKIGDDVDKNNIYEFIFLYIKDINTAIITL